MIAKKTGTRRIEKWTAYHEAGHAVAFYLFGVKLEFVTIVADLDRGFTGMTKPVGKKSKVSAFERFNKGSLIEGRLDFERTIMITLAGYAAELKYRVGQTKMTAAVNSYNFGKTLTVYRSDDPTFDGDFRDIQFIFNGFVHLIINDALETETERDAYLRWLWYRTVNIITSRSNWAAVKEVVAALLDKKRLSGNEVQNIIEAKNVDRMGTLIHHNQWKVKQVFKEIVERLDLEHRNSQIQ